MELSCPADLVTSAMRTQARQLLQKESTTIEMINQIIQMSPGHEHDFRCRMEVARSALDVIFESYSISDLQALV